MNKQTILNALNGAMKVLKKHSPEILTGIGIVGMIATTITAVRATPKALELIDEREIKERKRLNNVEVVQTTWKCYIPAAITGTLSAACLIGASSVNVRRNAALATAYTLSEAALREYKEKAVEVVGERKEQAIRDAVAKDKVKQKPVSTSEVIITGKGDVLCLDVISMRYFKSSRDALEKAANKLNKRMRDDMFITLNDLYDELDLTHIKLGDDLGWDIDRDGYIDLQFSAQLAEDGTPCLVMDYLVPPRYQH